MSGVLHVIATPLGNAADLSPRAREVLSEVACVYCEDTRTTGRLLSYLGIEARGLRSLHSHNEESRVEEVLHRLGRGEDLGLVSDAGTPGISDPGSRLVAAAHEAGMRVAAVPGPSAVTALLSCAGFPGASFESLGFLPKARGARKKLLAGRMRPGAVLVMFVPMRDAPALLGDIAGLREDALCVLGRELTKKHEEILRAGATELAAELASREHLLGEATVSVWLPSDADRPENEELVERARRGAEALLEKGLSRKDAARLVADLCNLPRRRATEIVLSVDRS